MTSVSVVQTGEPSALRIYLDYDFLLVEDLSGVLDAVRTIYEQAFWSDIPALIGTPRQRQNGVRVTRSDTSHSIVLELHALGQTIAGLDPTLAGIGGGAVALGLTARILIHTLRSGHEALSAARMRELEVRAGWAAIEAENTRTSLDLERAGVELEVVRRDAEFRDFVQSAIRATASVDFARAVARNETMTENLGRALLNAWSVLQNDNINTARINDVEVKSVQGERATDDQQGAGPGPGAGTGTPEA
ncbi:hypothetical protein ACLQ3B_12585 [Micromonospora sp. DT53]|uniref:hypothetical protein n=1 Tax=Micromonospora sp. DT53 TaxID=3393444 RepID=UPI003CF1ED94